MNDGYINEYRNQCLTASFDNLANYFNEILSLSGILVLQQRVEYGNPSASLFPSNLLNAMRKQLLSTLYKCKKFDAKILPTVSSILNGYIKDDIDGDAARIQLLQLCGDLKDEERHVLQAIVELIPSLYDCNMKTPSESHLASIYVHPFIHGLFSSKRPSKIAYCSNLMVDEQTSTNTRRPDYKTDVYESYEFAYTTTFGEIKAKKDVSPADKVTDFHRIAIFCKDAIDNFNLSTTIGFQVVEKTITFFAMNLQYKHLYTFTEIVSLEIPLKKSDLLNLVGRFDDLATLSYIHDNLCTLSTRDISHLRIETSQYSYCRERLSY